MADDLGLQWGNLRISREEEAVINYEEEISTSDRMNQRMNCLIIGKLVNGKTANINGLRRSLDRAWRIHGDLAISGLEEGLLGFQFSNPHDRDRILAGRPWLFDDILLCLEPVRADQQPANVDFSKSPFWVQISDVPFGMRSRGFAAKLGESLGGILELDERGSMQSGCSFRIRVLLDITKPLRRGIRIELKDGSRRWVSCKYERLGLFCYSCGIIGHSEKICNNKQPKDDSKEAFAYGPWLRAPQRLRGGFGGGKKSESFQYFFDTDSSVISAGSRTEVLNEIPKKIKGLLCWKNNEDRGGASLINPDLPSTNSGSLGYSEIIEVEPNKANITVCNTEVRSCANTNSAPNEVCSVPHAPILEVETRPSITDLQDDPVTDQKVQREPKSSQIEPLSPESSKCFINMNNPQSKTDNSGKRRIPRTQSSSCSSKKDDHSVDKIRLKRTRDIVDLNTSTEESPEFLKRPKYLHPEARDSLVKVAVPDNSVHCEQQ